MNPVYVSAFAALAGSLIGGLTTFATAWATQRQQANVQWLLQEKTRRQELYQQFIEDASKLYVDALIHDQVPIPSLVGLYASMNKMKVVSTSNQIKIQDDKEMKRLAEALDLIRELVVELERSRPQSLRAFDHFHLIERAKRFLQ